MAGRSSAVRPMNAVGSRSLNVTEDAVFAVEAATGSKSTICVSVQSTGMTARRIWLLSAMPVTERNIYESISVCPLCPLSQMQRWSGTLVPGSGEKRTATSGTL
jgi:hypothetical protein